MVIFLFPTRRFFLCDVPISATESSAIHPIKSVLITATSGVFRLRSTICLVLSPSGCNNRWKFFCFLLLNYYYPGSSNNLSQCTVIGSHEIIYFSKNNDPDRVLLSIICCANTLFAVESGLCLESGCTNPGRKW